MVLSIAYTTERERAMGHTLPMSYTLAYTTEYWMWYNCGAPWIRQWKVLTMGLSTEYTMERAMGHTISSIFRGLHHGVHHDRS